MSKDELEFMAYWESVRATQSRFVYKFFKGLPFAFVFVIPVIISIITVYFLSPDWFSKFANELKSSLPAICTAFILFIFVYAYMRMHFKWEANEQIYLELKAKLNHEKSANNP